MSSCWSCLAATLTCRLVILSWQAICFDCAFMPERDNLCNTKGFLLLKDWFVNKVCRMDHLYLYAKRVNFRTQQNGLGNSEHVFVFAAGSVRTLMVWSGSMGSCAAGSASAATPRTLASSRYTWLCSRVVIEINLAWISRNLILSDSLVVFVSI